MVVPPNPFHVETLDLVDGPMAVSFVVSKRASRIALRWDPAAAQARVTLPRASDLHTARSFVAKQRVWLMTARRRSPVATASNGLSEGASIEILGIEARIERIAARAVGGFDRDASPPVLRVPCPAGADFSKRAIRSLKAICEAELKAAVSRHAKTLGVRVGRISVKDTRSRWGSCTSSGDLSFSWRLVLCPDWVLDYLAAHEVAHRREMNHSPAFWAHVAALTPRAAEARLWLRRNGVRLLSVGQSPQDPVPTLPET
jgi:predicted metal-dependent hydrolase